MGIVGGWICTSTSTRTVLVCTRTVTIVLRLGRFLFCPISPSTRVSFFTLLCFFLFYLERIVGPRGGFVLSFLLLRAWVDGGWMDGVIDEW